MMAVGVTRTSPDAIFTKPTSPRSLPVPIRPFRWGYEEEYSK